MSGAAPARALTALARRLHGLDRIDREERDLILRLVDEMLAAHHAQAGRLLLALGDARRRGEEAREALQALVAVAGLAGAAGVDDDLYQAALERGAAALAAETAAACPR